MVRPPLFVVREHESTTPNDGQMATYTLAGSKGTVVTITVERGSENDRQLEEAMLAGTPFDIRIENVIAEKAK